MERFCRDCKWFAEKTGDGQKDRCLHEKAPRDPEYFVRGAGTHICYASAMRAGICGREGKLFEPREQGAA